MATITLDSSTYTLQIPIADRSFFLSLVKKMGWVAKRQKIVASVPDATILALKEARAGKDAGVVNTDNIEDFIKSME